jgi:hypothetical protein
MPPRRRSRVQPADPYSIVDELGPVDTDDMGADDRLELDRELRAMQLASTSGVYATRRREL